VEKAVLVAKYADEMLDAVGQTGLNGADGRTDSVERVQCRGATGLRQGMSGQVGY